MPVFLIHRAIQWLRAFAQTTTYMGVAMIVLTWGGLFHLVNEEYENAYTAGLRQGRNLTRVFEEYISRVIGGVDSQLVVLRKLYEQDPANFDFANWVDSVKIQSGLTINFSIVGSDGILKLSSLGPILSKVDISDREHFRVHIDSLTDELSISAPVIGLTSGKWSIQLLRRITAPDGSFGGVVATSLDILQLEKFYNSIDIGQMGVITLVGFDGIIRARSGRDPQAREFIGQSLAKTKMFELVRQAPVGIYWNSPESTGRLDGIRRLINYRVIEGLPLIAVVGLAESDIFQQAVLETKKYYQIGFALTAFVLFAIGFGAARQMKLSNATAALERSKLSLEQTNTQFDTTLEYMMHGLCMFDAEQRLVICNRRYGEMYGLTPGQTKPGTTLRAIVEARVAAGTSPEDGAKYVEERLRESRKRTPGDIVDVLRDGRVISVSRGPMPNGGFVGIHRDITAQKQAEAQIVYMARHDALTGLANRAILLEKAEEALARLRQGGGGFNIFMLDLDLFKDVNDSLGHPVGDELLKAVARRLSACARETDTVARLGGDEFAILETTTGNNQRESAIVTANRLLQAVSVPYDLDNHQIDIGTSIGIVLAPEHGTDIDQLMKSADLALYKAKAEGRNKYRIFEAAMGADAASRRALELDLRNALIQSEFELYYQPIVDIKTRDVASVEALVRWHHPQRGMISPNDFIPIAEETGLINALGEWVLHKACADAASWPPHIKVAVNLSPVQFRKGNLVDTVSSVLTESGLPPQRLELEITESVLMQGSDENIGILHQLRGLGISIVLDDFGTGYSSRSYLRIFTFDKIKIDRSFVNELSKNADCAAIVSAVASLGMSLDVGTVAEGVETEDQLALVRAAGCTHAQGFLFGKPCPASALDFSRPEERGRQGSAA
jgi:diguanylate cyclase (GGDEF)-like protein/PAS domain S-box-containing protein